MNDINPGDDLLRLYTPDCFFHPEKKESGQGSRKLSTHVQLVAAGLIHAESGLQRSQKGYPGLESLVHISSKSNPLGP